jgi:hypothetical protein
MAKIAQEDTLKAILLALGRVSKAKPSSFTNVDTISTKIISANKKRRSLALTNTGSNPVFLGIGEAAVANQGIYLAPSGGTWKMDALSYSKLSIYGIAVGGTSNVAIQEFE